MKKSTFIIGLLATLAAIACLIIMLVCIATKAHCQTVYPYQADRPGMALGAYNVGVHQLDYESSVNYGKYFGATTTSITNQFRYGAFDHLEFRGGFNIQHSDYLNVAGISTINLGAKIPIIRDTAAFPAVALIGGAILPYAGKPEFVLESYLKSAAILIQKSFGSVTIMGNVGIMSDAHAPDGCYFMNPYSINHKAQGTYALAIYKYHGNIGVFIETYGYYGAGSSEPYEAFDLGLALMIKDNVSVDMSFGASYADGFDISFCNWGVGWLIPNKTK
jgi:hypothetical protein